jgi:tetratricopeptide (TPR) repeat protein
MSPVQDQAPDYDTYCMLGEAFMQIQEPEKAVRAFDSALEYNPKDAELIRKIAKALITTHDYQRAIDHYTRVRWLVGEVGWVGGSLCQGTGGTALQYNPKDAELITKLPRCTSACMTTRTPSNTAMECCGHTYVSHPHPSMVIYPNPDIFHKSTHGNACHYLASLLASCCPP